MENTSSLLFDNHVSKYYFVLNNKTYGPLTAFEVFQKIDSHELTLADYIWCEGWSDWKQISEVKDFETLTPSKPQKNDLEKIKSEIVKKKGEKSKVISKKTSTSPPVFQENISYYVYFHKTQYGPFSESEVQKIFESGKADANAFIWVQGWPNWKSVKDVDEFKDYVSISKPNKDKTKTKTKTKSNNNDLRNSPRKPLVARLFVTNNEDVIIAVCRDISLGGMQVLTDRIPGEIGTVVKLNVSPADSKNVRGFVAEGEIVRILEDGRGFSFRFTRITSDAKKAIQKYLDNE